MAKKHAKDAAEHENGGPTLTFEQVHAHVEAANFDELKWNDKAGAQSNLCGVWSVVKPVISFLSGFPLLPSKWKALVGQLITTLDLICADQPAQAAAAPK